MFVYKTHLHLNKINKHPIAGHNISCKRVRAIVPLRLIRAVKQREQVYPMLLYRMEARAQQEQESWASQD